MKLLALLSLPLLLACAACQHPQSAPPVSSAPPTLTSSPVPPPERPSAPPHVGHAAGENVRVWRCDFVLTPKDPKDATLTPTSFTINISENQTGNVMIGRNVPLQSSPAPAPTSPGAAPFPLSMARQDVGLKVSTHTRTIAGSDDLLMEVSLELSAVESGMPAATIRKVTANGVAVTSSGKPALIVSLDDDKRHYELSVTATKIR